MARSYDVIRLDKYLFATTLSTHRLGTLADGTDSVVVTRKFGEDSFFVCAMAYPGGGGARKFAQAHLTRDDLLLIRQSIDLVLNDGDNASWYLAAPGGAVDANAS